MFKTVPWSKELDLSYFYSTAFKKGFLNNCSEDVLVNCFKSEKKWQVWILYYNDLPVGSVAAHSFDDVMGANTYRVAARTCIFTDHLGEYLNNRSLRTRQEIITHQNATAQFLIPTCIEWAPKGSRLFITTNESQVGTQRLVHRIYAPLLVKSGEFKRVGNVFYRGVEQTIWEVLPDIFMKNLNEFRRWC